MVTTLELGDIAIEVCRKDVKNIHLSVYPPLGRVKISAPSHINLDSIRVFAISKLSWIRQQQKKLSEQAREAPREFSNCESHYVWGRRYRLKLFEYDGPLSIELRAGYMHFYYRPGADPARRQELLDNWYRHQIRKAAPPILAKWASIMGVTVNHLYVQRMKTRWGSCNPQKGNVRLNTDLAKKPIECLEYILVHEMTHLIAPRHNAQFSSLLDQFFPQWRTHRDELNRLPVRHEQWKY